MLKKCKYLLLLFVGLIGFTCFSNADTVSNLLVPVSQGNFTANRQSINSLYSVSSSNYGVYCISVSTWSDGGHGYNFLSFGYSSSLTMPEGGMYLNIYWDQVPATVCFKVNQPYIFVNNEFNYNISFDYELYRLDLLLDEDLPVMSSAECQSEYDLIPISDIDTNYCVENDLCPISTGSRSELVINNIVHEGRPLININIPDYIQWDYAVDENQYDIYVGSGYDQDYIDSVLKINSYRPDNKDFTQIFVSGLTLIFPYIFVALLIVFIWKLLKRVFK